MSIQPASRTHRRHAPRPLLQSDVSASLTPAAAQIVVVGVGGAGNNAVNRMIEAQIHGVRFLALNTDAQALALSQATETLSLGEELTQGLGAGGNPAVGAEAAEASRYELKEALRDADLIFLAAGMGGGTGTGAAPIVAQIARELGALVVGTVTLPFSFEGSRRRKVAQEGIRMLSESVDALIVVPNDRLLQVVGKDRTLAEAFRLADDILRQGVQGMTEVITVPGLVNVDFADVRTVMQQAGLALMSIGEGSGEEGAEQAAQMAVAGGWLGASIRGAKRVLLNITGGPHLTLFEVTQIASQVREAVDENADMIFGAVINPEMNDKIRVTLVAGGMSSLTGEPGTKQSIQLNETNERAGIQAEIADDVSPASTSPTLSVMRGRGIVRQAGQ